MGRKPARELIKRILKSLTHNPRTVQEIARAAESNWGSVGEYLESLKEAGIVVENQIGGKKTFSLAMRLLKHKSENYFDLPVTEEDKKTISSLFSKIREEWKKATGTDPGKIQVQTSLWRINRLCKLGLPIGWHLFGSMCVKPYDPRIRYEYRDLGKETENCVRDTVREYSEDPSAYSLKIRQYCEAGSKLYQTKELIMAMLVSSEFSIKNMQEINGLFYDLLISLPEIPNEDSKNLVNEFAGIVFRLVSSLPEEELRHSRPDILQGFIEIWKLIALYQYSGDLKEYYETNYGKDLLWKHFSIEISLQKSEIAEQMSHLESLLPPAEDISDPAYRKLKETFVETRPLTEEERKQREKKFKNERFRNVQEVWP